LAAGQGLITGLALLFLAVIIFWKGTRQQESGSNGSPKPFTFLLVILLILGLSGAGCMDDNDDDDAMGGNVELPPLPPDYREMAREMGLSETENQVLDLAGGNNEDDDTFLTINLESENIAFVRFHLQWQDEIDLAPPNPTGDNVVKNMGDTFAVSVETPWGLSFTSPGVNNYHQREGELIFEIRTDDLEEFSFLNYPDAETAGEFRVWVQCLDCGDQREFGNFGPEPSNLITEDDYNDWDMVVEYGVWEKN